MQNFSNTSTDLILQTPQINAYALEQLLIEMQPLISTKKKIPSGHDSELPLHAYRLHQIDPDQIDFGFFAQQCKQRTIDYALVPSNWTLKQFGLLAMDMDSTLITIECIDEIADKAGLKAQVSAITEATMRGEIADFKESLKQRVALLKGLNIKALDQVYKERLKLSPGAKRLIKHVQQAGVKTLLVSGGFTFFTDKLKHQLGLDACRANQLETDIDNKQGIILTGRVLGNILDAQGKADTLIELCQQHNISPEHAIAIGDGANDLLMMKQAGISVAYKAKPIVQVQARYALNYCGLDGILNWFE